MRVWDCHCHLRGDETGAFVLEQFTEAKIERVNLFSRYAGRGLGPEETVSQATVRETVDQIAEVRAADPARI